MTDDGGYATAAMAALSLAVSLVAAGLVIRSAAEFRAGRQDAEKLQAVYRLDGASTQAVAVLMLEPGSRPVGWRQDGDPEAFDVLAEPESRKLAAGTALDRLPPETLKALGVKDGPQAGRRLARGAHEVGELALVAEAGGAEAWRQCAPSLVSAFGGATAAPSISVAAPAKGALHWRVGEIWRIRVRDGKGWTDDRLVRFIGVTDRPVAVIDRRLFRGPAVLMDCAGLVGEGAP